MSRIVLDLDRKSDEEIIQFVQGVVNAMDGKVAYASVQTEVTAASDANVGFQSLKTTQINAEAAFKAATDGKNAARDADRQAVAALAAAMEAKTPPFTDEQILATGFALRAAPSPIGPLPAPLDLLAVMADNPGEMKLTWAPVRGAKVYEVDCKEHTDAAPWERVKSITRSKMTVTGLESGKTYAFRVRAVGAAGEGPWSDETVKMAP